MIILDTNVLSALMRPRTEELVEAWFNSIPPEKVWTTSITLFEVRFGLEILPASNRRRRLEDALTMLFNEDLEGRILPFDDLSAARAAEIAARERRSGRALEIRDLQIAGIASVRRAALATRNVKHFDRLGLTLLDPWATA